MFYSLLAPTNKALNRLQLRWLTLGSHRDKVMAVSESIATSQLESSSACQGAIIVVWNGAAIALLIGLYQFW